jgi:hypothetical protein
MDGDRLAALIATTAARVRLHVPGVDDHDPPRVLAFGRQLDARAGRRTDDPDRAPEQVAGYLAKYATKSAADTGDTTTARHRATRETTRRLATRAHIHSERTGAGSP